MFEIMGSGPGTLTEHAKQQAPMLADRLSDKSSRVRRAAALALGALGEHSKQYIPSLVNRLTDDRLTDDRSPRVRAAMAQALSVLGQHVDPHIHQLLADRLANHDSSRVRAAAAQALGALGEYAKQHSQSLADRLTNDRSPRVRAAAAQALGALGEYAKQHSQSLADRLTNDRSSRVRAAAAQALGALGEYAKQHSQSLADRLTNDRISRVRAAAAQALGALGEYAKQHSQSLADRLTNDRSSRVRAAAAQALGAFGEHAGQHASLLVGRLDDSEDEVRVAAVQALGGFGDLVAKDVLARFLTAEKDDVRAAALQALGALADHARKYSFLLEDLLRTEYRALPGAATRTLLALAEHTTQHDLIKTLSPSESHDFRVAAAQALVVLGVHAKQHMPLFFDLLRSTSEDSEVRIAAAQALGAFPERGAQIAPVLAEHLKDYDWEVGVAAARALGGLGEHASSYLPFLAKQLMDEDEFIREAAAQALQALGGRAGQYAPQLARRLDDDDVWFVREAAARAMGALGSPAKQHALSLAARLGDEHEDVRVAAAQALRTLGPFPVEVTPSILIHRYNNTATTGYFRFLAHFLGGADSEVETLLSWIGGTEVTRMDELKSNHDRVVDTLACFKKAWSASDPYHLLRKDFADHIGDIVTTIDWTRDDREYLDWFEKELRQSGFTAEANAVQQEIDSLDIVQLGQEAIILFSVHTVFWLGLIFVYPMFPQVQATFFWNRWIRQIVGLGYVGFLLTWVPFLRRRLFMPFEESLKADARIADFDEESYFQNSLIRLPNDEMQPATQAIARIRGQTILEGESGLGKTMLLRHLVKNYRTLVVFLLAADCSSGVLEAIQEKLEGPATDKNYLRKLIYAGALDVVIDGLNEASPDTRIHIVEFAKRFARGNLLLATQPMVWNPPPLSRVYTMQWLCGKQIENFLVSRYTTLFDGHRMSEVAFTTQCRNYISDVLDRAQPKGQHDAMRRALSNPMDLTVVAHMIANGNTPNLFKLQQQYFSLVSEDYRRQSAGNLEFPLKEFAERIYQMRLDAMVTLSDDEFVEELLVMASHKKVVSYHQYEKGMDAVRHWVFRHDKILDFFLVQAFVGRDNDRPRKHLGDPRFRGTYFQLASLLPLDAAKSLERELINYAADTRDHSVSDDFIHLLRSRSSADPDAAQST